MDLAVIILAGGKSKRMGKDKALLSIHGSVLVENLINKAKALTKTIYISGPKEKYDKLGLPVIDDMITNRGPLGGIYSSMKQSKAEYYLVLAVDLPLIKISFLEQLIKTAAPNIDACIPQHPDGKIEPLCALYHRNCIPVFEQQLNKNENAIYKSLAMLRCSYYPIKQPNTIFLNLNTPEDYSNYLEHYGDKKK